MSPEQPAEGSEWRAALLTYVPAILVAFLVNWALTSHTAWAPRRALIASIESRRVCRRLQPVRGLEHEHIEADAEAVRP